MEIKYGDIILCELKDEHIDNLVRWNTFDDKWMGWDAPWEIDPPFDDITHRERQLEYIMRYGFQIEYEGCHIGWVNAYKIDENYNHATVGRIALYIDIFEPDKWDIGRNAYIAFINYWFSCGYNRLYMQTCSDNERMMRMAEGIGFRLCHRGVGGHIYDVITMKIDKVDFTCYGDYTM